MSTRGVLAMVTLLAWAACSGPVAPGGPGCSSSHGLLETPRVDVGGGVAVRVAVYLPPGALEATSGTRYPALYLLHGSKADETQWPAIGVTEAADHLIDTGSIAPLVIIMPDIDADGRALLDAIVPWADAHLPLSPHQADRAIGGISRGGRTALRLAAVRPYRFARVGGHSAGVSGEDALALRLAAWGGPVWLDVGSHDPLRPGIGQLSSQLEGDGAVAQFHIFGGGHDRAYWGAHVEDYLRFYGRLRPRPSTGPAHCTG